MARGGRLLKRVYIKRVWSIKFILILVHIFPYMTPFSWRLSLLFFQQTLLPSVSAKISFLALLYAFNNRRCRPPHSSEIKTHNVFKVRVLNFYVKALGL
jgi:hypothetical protein